MFKNILFYMICGQAKIRSVHTYVIPWIHWLNRTVDVYFCYWQYIKVWSLSQNSNLVCCFSVCQVLLTYETDWKMSAHDELLAFFFVHTFAMLSTITNPILYGWLNTNLKHLFRAMIPTVRNERNETEAHEMVNLGKSCGNLKNNSIW